MQLRATSPVIPQREATSRSTGCAPTAQQGKSTAGQQVQSSVPASTQQAAQSVLAAQPANAIRWRSCILTELQSGTTKRMQTGPATTQLALHIRLGGRLESVEAGSKQSKSAHMVQMDGVTVSNLLKTGCSLESSLSLSLILLLLEVTTR